MAQFFYAILPIALLNPVSHAFLVPYRTSERVIASCLFSSSNGDNASPTEINRRSMLAAPVTALTSSLLLRPQPSLALEGTTNTGVEVTKFTSKSCQNPAKRPSKEFPLASFGLQVYDDETAYKLTLVALEVGYRNFFASVLARNQKGFARAVKASGIPRDDLYICGTVLSNRAQGERKAYAQTLKGCEENMLAMNTGGIDYLDMIMLDYPGPDAESIVGQWGAFQDFQRDGLVTDLAVSNFNNKQLDTIQLDKNTCSLPVVNQLPYSVTNHPKGLIADNAARGILVQSWSPLSSTLPKYKSVLANIGSKYKKSAAQVGLRWIVQNGASFCTQSQNKAHFKEDLEIFDFKLGEDEMNQISLLQPPPLLS